MIDELIEREGGYVNNPNDPGGETKYGITVSRARAYGYAGPMRNLPREKAAEIYRKVYWDRPGFGDVAKRSERVAEELFDTGVNMGQQIASKFLQYALNAFNNRGKFWKEIKTDGDIGPETLYAFDSMIAKRGLQATEKVLLRLLDAQQAVRYMTISEKNQKLEDFMFGWISNRVGDL